MRCERGECPRKATLQAQANSGKRRAFPKKVEA